MRVIIIEDEVPAATRLARMLHSISDEMDVIKQMDSISSAVKFLSTAEGIDLIFMDIQLADGLSFDIFKQADVRAPVIFTTAFDEYALKAFKVNSVDYLLKPIDENELKEAVDKYRKLFVQKENHFSENMQKLVQQIHAARFRERLLIKRGQQLSFLKTDAVAYCYADGKLCWAVDFNSSRFLLETNLSELEEQLQPSQFFRINRHLMVNIGAVSKVHNWLGGRLKLELLPHALVDTVVSRERVSGFRKWLGE